MQNKTSWNIDFVLSSYVRFSEKRFRVAAILDTFLFWIVETAELSPSTAEYAEKLTEMGEGKHHIGDFLPPDELERFMATYRVSASPDGKLDLKNLF